MAEQQVDIEYKKGKETFITCVTARSLDFFLEAAQQPEIRGKEGEALVSALVAYAKGAVCYVSRYRDGQRSDGPNGEPACVEFDGTGKIIAIERYDDGELVRRITDRQIIDAYVEQIQSAAKIGEIQSGFGGKLKVRML